MLDRSIYQEDITIINIYIPNIGASKQKANVNISEERSTQQYNNIRGPQYPTFFFLIFFYFKVNFFSQLSLIFILLDFSPNYHKPNFQENWTTIKLSNHELFSVVD